MIYYYTYMNEIYINLRLFYQSCKNKTKTFLIYRQKVQTATPQLTFTGPRVCIRIKKTET